MVLAVSIWLRFTGSLGLWVLGQVELLYDLAPSHPPIEPRVCQAVAFCDCGLTLQEVRYWVKLNSPDYGRKIGRDEFTRW